MPSQNQAASEIEFRFDVQPEDRDLVRDIVASTGVFSPVEIDVAVELVDERLAHGLPSGYYFIFAERGGKTLGYACYGPICLTESSYDLFWIAVEKSCQGQKIGQLLLAKSEEHIRAEGGGISISKPRTAPNICPRARSICRSGYQREALLKDFYGPGDDKVIYSKKV